MALREGQLVIGRNQYNIIFCTLFFHIPSKQLSHSNQSNKIAIYLFYKGIFTHYHPLIGEKLYVH